MEYKSCTGCGIDHSETDSLCWWWLNHYYGFNGRFCPECYDKISHDSYGNPNRPKDYTLMLLKLSESFEQIGR